MQSIVQDIGRTLWRLLPGNPILVRVVSGGSKRTQYLWIRAGYLSALLFVVLISQLSVGGAGGSSLASHAKNASQVFQVVSYVQLALMCFLAPVFTAGAITQEKDAQTFNILLTTPLSNLQIVLGSLLSRLFFVLVLLAAGLPIFCMTMLYGGVTGAEIIRSFGIAGCTAILTGSLAIAISMMRVGTRRTIFSFYMAIALYLLLVLTLGLWSGSWIAQAPATATHALGMSWLTPLHPFLSLMAALGTMNVPTPADLGGYGGLTRWALSEPYNAYMVLTLLVSLGLVVFAAFLVRRGAREGEVTWWTRLVEWLKRRSAGLGDRRRKPRNVWRNPVAWREATTRASAASQGWVRYVFIIGGLVAALFVWLAYVGRWGGFTAVEARDWLTALVLIEFMVMLLMAVNTAATGITREREAQTMELLLATPLTSQYIVWGKLRGLVSFTVPLIAVPVASVVPFVIFDLFAAPKRPVVYPEALLTLPLLMLAYSALACLLGLHTSLKSRRTVQAVLTSVGILVVLGFGVGACGYVFTSSAADSVGPLVAPFTMVVAIATAVNPELTLQTTAASTIAAARVLMLVGSLIALGVYAAAVHAIYKSMVKNFDMIVRKQSV